MSYLKTLNANFDIMRKIHADLHSTTPHHVWNLRVGYYIRNLFNFSFINTTC